MNHFFLKFLIMTSFDFYPKRLILSREVTSEDYPIWRGGLPGTFIWKDRLYALGSNIVFWFVDEKTKRYYPGIANPMNPRSTITSYADFQVEDPLNVIFLAGKQIDIIIQPYYVENPTELLENYNGGFVAYVIAEGQIIKIERITVAGLPINHRLTKKNMVLYQDKFVVFQTASTVFMVNIYTGNASKTFKDLPSDSAIILDKSDLILWSAKDSKRCVLCLESGESTMLLLERVPPDLEIIGHSISNLLVGSKQRIVFYSSSGAVIINRSLDPNTDEIFDGVIDSYNSSCLAFVLRMKMRGIVFTYREGTFHKHEIGMYNTSSMILYEGSIYIPMNRTALEYWSVENLSEKEINTSVSILPVNRYTRVSPSFGWVMELRPSLLDSQTSVVVSIRSPACRPMELPLITKKSWPEIAPDKCAVPLFMFKNRNGQVKIWIAKEYKTKIGTKELLIHIFDWDMETENIGAKVREISNIELPKHDVVAKWIKTDRWIVFVLGKTAHIFDHDGVKADTEVHVDSVFDFNIKAVRGFGPALWFLCGQTNFVKNDLGETLSFSHIKKIILWSGVRKTKILDLDPGLDMQDCCATGNHVTENRFNSHQIVISSAFSRANWTLIQNVNDAFIVDKRFYQPDDLQKPILCNEADLDGRVFFSEARTVKVYNPESRTIRFKADLDYIHSNQDSFKMIARPQQDYVRSMAIGSKYLWVACGSSFCHLLLNSVNDFDVTETMQPVKPIKYIDEKRPRAVFQPPDVIRTYRGNGNDYDDQAVFENGEYLWLSDLPLNLYKKSTAFSCDSVTYVTFSSRGRMLIMMTKFCEPTTEGTGRTLRSSIYEAIL